MYRIIGTDRRYGMIECYGEFKELRDCVAHMDTLMRSFGNIIRFRCVEFGPRGVRCK